MCMCWNQWIVAETTERHVRLVLRSEHLLLKFIALTKRIHNVNKRLIKKPWNNFPAFSYITQAVLWNPEDSFSTLCRFMKLNKNKPRRVHCKSCPSSSWWQVGGQAQFVSKEKKEMPLWWHHLMTGIRILHSLFKRVSLERTILDSSVVFMDRSMPRPRSLVRMKNKNYDDSSNTAKWVSCATSEDRRRQGTTVPPAAPQIFRCTLWDFLHRVPWVVESEHRCRFKQQSSGHKTCLFQCKDDDDMLASRWQQWKCIVHEALRHYTLSAQQQWPIVIQQKQREWKNRSYQRQDTVIAEPGRQ